MVKISVVIPAYNVEKFIGQCLDSVLAQTLPDFEVIIIDDGSKDRTGEICDEYARKDMRITVVHRQNGGVSSARNKGIDMASGEYIHFFDADDFADPCTFDEVYSLAAEHRADAVLFGYHKYQDGGVIETCPPVFDEGLYQDGEIIPKLLSRFVGISSDGVNGWLAGDKSRLYVENPALWRALVKRDVVTACKIRFDERLKVGEDTVFISDMLSCCRRCFVTGKCYYYLLVHESSTISQYEQKPFAKLEGKVKLMAARADLTERVSSRCGVDIQPYWEGTVLMSCVEMAFLLAKKNVSHRFSERYRAFLSYVRREDVRAIVRSFKLGKKTGVMPLPFMMLKGGLYLPLFLCMTLLGKTNYKFARG